MSNVKATAPSLIKSLKPHGISRNILETLICIAVIRGDYSLLEYGFVLADDDSDLKKMSEKTSICIAINFSPPNVGIWRLLLDNGFYLGQLGYGRRGDLETLARFALTGDQPHLELLELLFQHGLTISNYAFSLAAEKLDAEGIRWLVSKCESQKIQSGALITAARCNSASVVEILIDAGMDVNYVAGPSNDPFDGRPSTSPLIEAASVGNLEVVKLLLERGATNDWTNNHGWSAARIVANRGYPDVAEFIRNFSSLDPSV
jgi:hypothetical protein